MNKPTTSIAAKRRFVNFTMSEAELAALDEVAERNGRTRSGEARYAIRNHVAAEQAEVAETREQAA